MIVLLPNGTPRAYKREKLPAGHYGWLATPRCPKRWLRRAPGELWAADNECYTLGARFDFGRYMQFLESVRDYPGKCLFVTVPDVVGNWWATDACWRRYAPEVARIGLPLAYIAQDGLDALPDGAGTDYRALFVGGTSEWKDGAVARRLIGEARAAGLWVHVGRVNKPPRMRRFEGLADSFDGTTYAIAPDDGMRRFKQELLRQHTQPRLLDVDVEVK